MQALGGRVGIEPAATPAKSSLAICPDISVKFVATCFTVTFSIQTSADHPSLVGAHWRNALVGTVKGFTGGGAACDVVGIWGGAFSGHMKVSFQAARSIG